ncbi:hypothetical protein ABUL39_02975 [Rhodothermus marinus]|uniref:hypothetical protein n=1 Tax=Rhodothermus marinus TaxID=29549 RepID=UPI0037C6CD9D
MLELQVRRARQEDVYRDLVRIPEVWRKDCNGEVIPEGSVCKIKILKDNRTRTGYAIVRGVGDESGRVIYVDERLRNFLGIKPGDSVQVVLKKTGLIGQLIWAWRASDPAYRVAARLAVLSFILGLLGFILGVFSLISAR